MSELQQQWAETIQRWHGSGQSIAAWCREHEETYHRFLYWRKRLEPQSRNSGGFVALSFAAEPLTLECQGVCLQIERGFDPDLLQDVLSVLRRM